VEAGHDVVSVDRETVPGLAAEQVRADLSDASIARETIEASRADAVVHLAAIAVPFSAPEQHILTTNTTLASNVMLAAAELGITKLVAASSPTVIGYGAPGGWTPTRLPLDEAEPTLPWNAYSLSKLMIEGVGRMLALHSNDTVRFAAFRPCYVIAPEEWDGAPTQQGHTVQERLTNPALAAPALFNYVDARDAARFVVMTLDALNDIPNAQTFFVGAADALAREPLADLLPRFHPSTAGLAQDLSGTTPAFSIAKARDLLGWEPHHSWRTALTTTLESA
jgi:nucleoside-diphosphate-sugar epimerase